MRLFAAFIQQFSIICQFQLYITCLNSFLYIVRHSLYAVICVHLDTFYLIFVVVYFNHFYEQCGFIYFNLGYLFNLVVLDIIK